MVQRDSDNQIVTYTESYYKYDVHVSFRYGQLTDGTEGGKINGIGRRLYLKHYNSDEYYYDSEDYDFIEEG